MFTVTLETDMKLPMFNYFLASINVWYHKRKSILTPKVGERPDLGELMPRVGTETSRLAFGLTLFCSLGEGS